MANRTEVLSSRNGMQPASRADGNPAGHAATDLARRIECGNPACRRGWLGFLKDRRRPVFEDRWACSAHCLRNLVDASIRRESFDSAAQVHPEHRHRLPLGLILLEQGWVTQSQLQHALAMQRHAAGGRIGRWLVEECGVPEDRITRGLGLQWGCPVLSTDGFAPRAMALAAPRLLIEQTGVLPLCAAGSRLYLAFAEQHSASAAFAIERMSSLKVESGILNTAHWRAAQRDLLACTFIDASFEQLPDRDTLSRRIASDLAGLQPRASRLVRVHQSYWLRLWLEDAAMRASGGGLPTTTEDVLDRIYAVGPQCESA